MASLVLSDSISTDMGYQSVDMTARDAKVKFGRHESFPLRFGWINKGLTALQRDASIFSSPDAIVILGVGKNMVSSMRHWLEAARLIRPSEQRKEFVATLLGETVFGPDGDPYLEEDGTIWLLHWLLASNPRGATNVYWFFNHFHKTTFTSNEVDSGLRHFAYREMSLRTAASTLKRDANLLLRMYSGAKAIDRQPIEDSLDSPLSLLDLLHRLDEQMWFSVPTNREEVPDFVFDFAVAELFAHLAKEQLTIRELMYSSDNHCAPGSVFRLSEDGLINRLEMLCHAYSDIFNLSRTAGVFQLFKLRDFDPYAVVQDSYGKVK